MLRKYGKILILAAVLAILAGGFGLAQTSQAESKGTFTLILNGIAVGETQWTKTEDGRIKGDTNLELPAVLGGKTSQKDTLAPGSYHFEKEGGGQQVVMDAHVEGNKLIIKKDWEKDETTIELKETWVIIENNSPHHFLTLDKILPQNPGESISFEAVVPTMSLAVPAVLEYKGLQNIPSGNSKICVKHYLLAAGRTGINLYYDKAGVFFLATVPFQYAEYKLKDYTPETFPLLEEPAEARDFSEEEIKIPSGKNMTLAGSLLIPKNVNPPYPVLIFISGSGPQDRNEDTVGPGGLKGHIFQDIAEYLSNRGFATLRYDDRGVGKSTGDFKTADLNDFVADVKAVVEFIRKDRRIDPDGVILLGHSEGGIIAPIVAEKDKKISKLVLLAGTATPLDEVILEQSQAMMISAGDSPEKIEKARKETIEFVEAIRHYGEKDFKVSPAMKKKVEEMKSKIKWFQQHFQHDPIATIKKVDCPILILNGDKDLQVLPHHAEDLGNALKEAGKTDYKVVIFPGLDHLFMEAGNFPAISAYADTSRRIEKEALETIYEWLSNKRLKPDTNKHSKND